MRETEKQPTEQVVAQRNGYALYRNGKLQFVRIKWSGGSRYGELSELKGKKKVVRQY